MAKLTPQQRLERRMKTAKERLQKLAVSKTSPGKQGVVYQLIGANLGVTNQTVGNYIDGRGSNGFLIEALIEEFEKLPTPVEVAE